MVKSIRYIGFFLLLFLFLTNCKKPQVYPDTPQINFTKFLLKDTIDILDNPIKQGTLAFSFIDGDGDIGLHPYDTTAPYDSIYFYNLYLTLYSKENGKFEKVDLPFPLRYRIPYVAKEGQNKTLKGSTEVKLIYNYPLQYDTIYYTFYIYDRALHKSNITTSDTIIF